MEVIVDFLGAYEGVLLFGVIMNFLLTFAFGIYKSLNLNYEQTVRLMEKYPVKSNNTKLMMLWFLPWVGVAYVFLELSRLQKYLNRGQTVYEYIEKKLQEQMAANS